MGMVLFLYLIYPWGFMYGTPTLINIQHIHLTMFLFPHIDPWALRGGFWSKHVIYAECSKLSQYLHIVHLCVSLLIILYYKKSLLWWELSDTLISGYGDPNPIDKLDFSFCGFLSVISDSHETLLCAQRILFCKESSLFLLGRPSWKVFPRVSH